VFAVLDQSGPSIQIMPGSYLPADFNAAPASSSAAPAVDKKKSSVTAAASALNIFESLPDDFLRPPSYFRVRHQFFILDRGH
jgi:hypothetical protein